MSHAIIEFIRKRRVITTKSYWRQYADKRGRGEKWGTIGAETRAGYSKNQQAACTERWHKTAAAATKQVAHTHSNTLHHCFFRRSSVKWSVKQVRGQVGGKKGWNRNNRCGMPRLLKRARSDAAAKWTNMTAEMNGKVAKRSWNAAPGATNRSSSLSGREMLCQRTVKNPQMYLPLFFPRQFYDDKQDHLS